METQVTHVDLSSPVFIQGGIATTSKFPAQGMRDLKMTWNDGHVFYSFKSSKGTISGVLPNSILGNVTFADPTVAQKPQSKK